MTELVRRDTDTWTDVLPAVGDLAGKIANTEFVPDAMRGKPAVVAAAILYGREIGMSPMTALNNIDVIKGKPRLKAEAQRALVLAAGHDIYPKEMTNTRCVMVGRRRGADAPIEVAFTMDDAKRMGLAGSQQYSKMPRQMLVARATTELCRLLFADVVGGLLTEVEDEHEADELAPVAPAAPITTAKRRKAPAGEAVPKVGAPVAEPDPEPEPVLDDDIVEAELVDEPEPEPEPEPVDDGAGFQMESPPAESEPKPTSPEAPGVELVRERLGGEVIDERASGAALAREALKQAASESRPASGGAPISPMQLKALQAGFKECGIDDREERLRIAAALAGRRITSANDLTSYEAKTVIDGLKVAKSTPDPITTLKGML